MLSELTISLLLLGAAVLAACGVIVMIAGIVALARARPLRFTLRTLFGLTLLASGALVSAIAVGVRGYQALTHEQIAAHVTVRPVGPQRFTATFRFPNGRKATYELAGDELYVDAHILKWKPIVNVLGLHTVYELDRVAGRYHGIEQERSAARTVYPLSRDKPVDLFSLRRRYAFLSPLLDAEYGSGSFLPATRSAELELRVSTTGLLLRESTGVPR
ncbi:MAG TPA: hypothetical protein VJ834_17805 [Burkholderiales bacterium]|nr:hypothetical protein [Burkholderiales bacterium]